MSGIRGVFRRPLARWGFTVCALVALATAQPGPFLVCTVLALYAWRCRR
ncbi:MULTISPECIES: hypothetical protein [Streptomyces]|nr:hypothetical protein [Streptomyces sp. PAM3C]MBU5946783.1 hypothetical protein [Streptomyces sp. PAM3C]